MGKDDDDAREDNLQTFLVPDKEDPETGQVVKGKLKKSGRGGYRKHNKPLKVPPFEVFVKVDGDYRHWTTWEKLPCPETAVAFAKVLRETCGYIAENGGNAIVRDQKDGVHYVQRIEGAFPGLKSPPNPSHHPSMYAPPPGYPPGYPPQPGAPAPYPYAYPPPQPNQMEVMTTMVPMFTMMIEAVGKIMAAASRPAAAAPQGSLAEQIDTLAKLRELAQDMKPDDDETGVAQIASSVISGLAGAARGNGGIPVPPPPQYYQQPPVAVQPAPTPAPVLSAVANPPPAAAEPASSAEASPPLPNPEASAAAEAQLRALCESYHVAYADARIWLMGRSESADPVDWLRVAIETWSLQQQQQQQQPEGESAD